MEIKTSVHTAVQTAQIEHKSIDFLDFETEESSSKKTLTQSDIFLFGTGITDTGGKPSLTAPLFYPDPELMQDQLAELADPENAERLDDLQLIRFMTPEKIAEKFTQVLQREVAKTESAGNRALTEALELDDVALRKLAAAVQLMLACSLQKESVIQQQSQQDVLGKITSSETVKRDPFVGIQTNDMMRLLFSLLRQVMAELNVSERRINTMFSELSVTMVKKAAESTVREGKEMFKGALMGFCTAVTITAVGTGFQARGLYKQNQAVEKSLRPANQNQQDKQALQQIKNQTVETTAEQRIVTGKDGKTYRLEDTPTPAEQKQFDSQNQKAIDDTAHHAELYGQDYDQKTNKYRTQNSIADQLTRTSDNAGQLANASNMAAVKGAEADKMVENIVADTARNTASDKEKQIEKSGDAIREMRNYMNLMHEATVKTNQALVRG